ncbi:hypothetical protein UUU_05870 [Klebsiella pneumoniae subsp. pneumoniae DSM 30104 = JCM 1662 = NBRC 14940]|nr:hypothetical protein UUU_05870 [Klebsiella pneumoniae subsp. pneumoniae DSM 30104 = JCM 1662 = NBRC 14940]
MQRIAHHPAQHIAAEIAPVIDRPALGQRTKLLFKTIQHLLRQLIVTGNDPSEHASLLSQRIM